jgi:hypothetical protein
MPNFRELFKIKLYLSKALVNLCITTGARVNLHIVLGGREVTNFDSPCIRSILMYASYSLTVNYLSRTNSFLLLSISSIFIKYA